MARNFRSRVSMASTLDKMGLPEISEMIDFRWRVASGNQDHPFTPEALESISIHSEGIPREACIIADNSLLLAFLQKKAVIARDLVEIAAKDRKDNIGSAGRPEMTKPHSQKKGKSLETKAGEVVPTGQEVTTNG